MCKTLNSKLPSFLGFWDCIQKSYHVLYSIFFFFSIFQQKSCSPSSFRGKFVQSLRSHATASWPQREIWGGEKWPQRNEQRLWKYCQSHKQRSKSTLQKKLEQSFSNKVEKILKGSLDLILSPAHNLNFHWRWRRWNWIQATFLNLFYFIRETLFKFLL